MDRQRSARIAAWSGGAVSSKGLSHVQLWQQAKEKERALLFDRLKRAIQRLLVNCLKLLPTSVTPSRKGKRC